MKRQLASAGAAAAIVLAAVAAPASAASPQSAGRLSMKIGAANGFAGVSERVSARGTVVDTFRSSTTMVRFLGSPGSTVSFFPVRPSRAHSGSLAISMSVARPKSRSDVSRYHDSGRTVVGDLVALGMPRADAIREFGDMETLEGTAPVATDAQSSANSALSAGVATPSVTPLAVSTTTLRHDVHEHQCQQWTADRLRMLDVLPDASERW